MQGILNIETLMLTDEQLDDVQAGAEFGDFPDTDMLRTMFIYTRLGPLGSFRIHVMNQVFCYNEAFEGQSETNQEFRALAREEMQQGLMDPSHEDCALLLDEMAYGLVNQERFREIG